MKKVLEKSGKSQGILSEEKSGNPVNSCHLPDSVAEFLSLSDIYQNISSLFLSNNFISSFVHLITFCWFEYLKSYLRKKQHKMENCHSFVVGNWWYFLCLRQNGHFPCVSVTCLIISFNFIIIILIRLLSFCKHKNGWSSKVSNKVLTGVKWEHSVSIHLLTHYDTCKLKKWLSKTIVLDLFVWIGSDSFVNRFIF